MNERYHMLTALKGPAIKCLIALVWEQRQLTVTELETRIGHDKNTVRKALAQLALFGLAGQVISSQETWHLTDKGYQLPLPLNTLPDAGVMSASGEKNFHPVTTAAAVNSDLNLRLSSSSSSNSGENFTSPQIPGGDVIMENLATLHSRGIMGKKADKIAHLDWATPDYINAHVDQVIEDGDRLGLAIVRMEDGDPAPESTVDSWQKYLSGKYADHIEH